MAEVRMLAPSGQLENVASVSSTELKNSFADVLDKTVAAGLLAITRHDKARAVLLSLPEYEALVKRAGDPLEHLGNHFDAMVDKMQGAGTSRAIDKLFGAPAKASRKAARR